MDLSPPFRCRHLMLFDAASWQGSKYSLRLFLCNGRVVTLANQPQLRAPGEGRGCGAARTSETCSWCRRTTGPHQRGPCLTPLSRKSRVPLPGVVVGAPSAGILPRRTRESQPEIRGRRCHCQECFPGRYVSIRADPIQAPPPPGSGISPPCNAEPPRAPHIQCDAVTSHSRQMRLNPWSHPAGEASLQFAVSTPDVDSRGARTRIRLPFQHGGWPRTRIRGRGPGEAGRGENGTRAWARPDATLASATLFCVSAANDLEALAKDGISTRSRERPPHHPRTTQSSGTTQSTARRTLRDTWPTAQPGNGADLWTRTV